MEDGEIALAIDLARDAAGAGPDVPAAAVVVHRLDTGTDYVLVRLGAPGEPGWIAAVEPAARDVMSWAANESGGSNLPASSGVSDDYVWVPSSVSPSPLYPLVRVTTSDGERYRDITGVLHESLTGHRG